MDNNLNKTSTYDDYGYMNDVVRNMTELKDEEFNQSDFEAFRKRVSKTGAVGRVYSTNDEITRETFIKAGNGDQSAIESIYLANAGLIRYAIARTKSRMFSNSVTDEDLLSYASQGMANAITTFDPDKGIQFTTYAYTCIWRNIQHIYVQMRSSYQQRDVLSGASIVPLDAKINSEDANSSTYSDIIADPDQEDFDKPFVKTLSEKLIEFMDDEIVKELFIQKAKGNEDLGVYRYFAKKYN